MDTSNFGGIAVISFESRLAEAMARDIRAQGGRPVSAPSLREVPLAENAEILSFGEKLFAGKIDALVCMTGVGTQILLETLAARWDIPSIIDRLGRVTVVARGPKPAQVLRDNGVSVTLVIPEPDTTAEIIETLDQSPQVLPLDGKTVAVQEHGASNARLVQALKERGAKVLQVPVYRWALPLDTAPLLAGIREVIGGRVQVALFTNAAQVDHLLRFSSGEGLEAPLREALKKLVIASIGPSTSEGLSEQGLPVDFEPSRPKMELLVEEAARSSSELIRQKREGPPRPHVKPEHLRVDVAGARAGAAARRDSPFLKACRRESAPVTPVWLMRQAGRYMKSYRDIRSKVSFLELCRNRELAAEVAVAAAEKLKADAAILFSDILLIVEPLGLGLEYESGSGPEITGRVAAAADVDALREIEPAESLGYVFDATRLTRAALAPELPLIGFSGAPFTLAAYVIEGGSSRSFLKTKRFMYSDPGAWNALLEKISRGLVKYLNGQIANGADAVQIFDSWVGCLSPEDYRAFVLPHTRSVIRGITPGVPVLHFGTGTGPFLRDMREAGGDVIGVDWRLGLDEAWAAVGHDRAVQGNLDPAVLCSTPQVIREHVKRILDQAGGRPGHIFNLGHGILPQTPEQNAVALVETVHEMSGKKC